MLSDVDHGDAWMSQLSLPAQQERSWIGVASLQGIIPLTCSQALLRLECFGTVPFIGTFGLLLLESCQHLDHIFLRLSQCQIPFFCSSTPLPLVEPERTPSWLQ